MGRRSLVLAAMLAAFSVLASTGTAFADSGAPPNQGDPDKVTSVFSGYVCAGTFIWRDVIQGDAQQKTVSIAETLPIVEVRIKSGSKAALVSAVFSGNFLSATVTISQGVTNYAWSVCQLGDTEPPTVTVNQAAAQADPTGSGPILFDVAFSEAVTGFTETDVVLSGTAGATTAELSGSGPTYQVAVSGMTATGTVIATIPAGAALDADADFLGNTASTSADNTVTFAVAAPTATPTVTPTATPTPSPSPTATQTPSPTPAPTATADPTGSVAPSTTKPSLPDTAAAVEAGSPPPAGGSVPLVLAVLVGIAAVTTMLTVKRTRRH